MPGDLIPWLFLFYLFKLCANGCGDVICKNTCDDLCGGTCVNGCFDSCAKECIVYCGTANSTIKCDLGTNKTFDDPTVHCRFYTVSSGCSNSCDNYCEDNACASVCTKGCLNECTSSGCTNNLFNIINFCI